MRIRSIRPEFWTSEDIASLSWDARLVFIGLWSYVDDNGVGRDVEKLILADLFPLEDDPRDTLAKVSQSLDALAARSLIARYEVDGKPYLHITTWATHQKIDRPGKERYPLPTSADAVCRETVATTHRPSRDTPSTGEGEKGRRGEGLSSDQSDATDDGFAEFYDAYPRKEAKRKAEQAWRSALKRADRQAIMDGLARFTFGTDRQFIPLPASWLNADRWADVPSAQVTPLRPGQELTREQVEDILGPDYETLIPPPEVDPDDDFAGYQAWIRDARAERHAKREQRARAQMERAR